MRAVAERLSGTDLRSIGDANRVSRILLKSAVLVEEAVRLLSGEDAVLRSRSADALEKAARERPEILAPHRRSLLKLAATATQQEVRWHIAQMLPLLDLTAGERKRATVLLRKFLRDRSRFVQVCAMQALWDLEMTRTRPRASVYALVKRIAKSGSPAVRARARRLLAGASKTASK